MWNALKMEVDDGRGGRFLGRCADVISWTLVGMHACFALAYVWGATLLGRWPQFDRDDPHLILVAPPRDVMGGAIVLLLLLTVTGIPLSIVRYYREGASNGRAWMGILASGGSLAILFCTPLVTWWFD